MNSISRIH